MRRRYTGEQRSALIDLVTAGRATVSEAGRRLGVTKSTAYGWIKRAAPGRPRRRNADSRTGAGRTGPLAPATFVRLVRAGDLAATLTVRVGGAEVQVARGFDAELLRAVVQALRGDAA